MVHPDVTVSIVSFNTRELLSACLASVLASTDVTLEVVVVDNGSSDGSPDLVRTEFPGVEVVANPDNRGFAAANNIAIARARGRHILLLNPDTVVPPGTIAAMAGFLDGRPDTAICGPRILNSDGTFQSCGYHFPSPLTEVRASRHVGRWLRALVGDEPAPPCGTDAPYECDWVDGACLLIRRAAVDRIGPLDEQFFLYTEEVDWCFAARKAGWKVFALPRLEMIHHRGQSTEQVSDRSLALLVETKLRYFRKNHGLPTAVWVSLVNAAGFLVRMRHDARKNRAKLRGVRQFWASVVPASLAARPGRRSHRASGDG